MHAVAAPGISPLERGAAGAALCLFSFGARARPCLVGALLGSAAALQLHCEWTALASWADGERIARVRVLPGARGESVPVRAGSAGRPDVALLLHGSAEIAALRTARHGWARLQVHRLPSARNPDDRNPMRSRLGTPLLAARLLDFEADDEVARAANPLRARLLATVDRRLSGSAPLWRALWLGDRHDLSIAVQERVRRLGLSHLLALSGMHVGGLLGALAMLRRDRRVPLWSMLPLAVWIVLAGASASLLRAGLMALWLLLARRWQRELRPEDALAFAGLLDLCWNPARPVQVGWCLSYAATYGLIRVAPHCRGNRLSAAIRLGSTAAAMTLPWSIAVFGQITWLSPLNNLLVAVPFALLMVGGVALGLLGALHPAVAFPCDAILQLLSHGFGALLRLLDRNLPGPVGHPALHGAWWAGALALWLLALLPRPRLRWRLLCVASVTMLLHLPLLRANSVRWWSLDVGQGDAGVLRDGDDWLVVDSGPLQGASSAAERVLLPFLRRRNVSAAGYLITHGHLDHMGGAEALLRSGRLSQLFMAAADSDRSWCAPLRTVARRSAVQVQWLARGDSLRLGALRLPVLWPPAIDAPEHANDRSLVVVAGPPAARILLCGDLERVGEGALLASSLPENISVLKLAHHGGDTGSDAPWLRRLDPELVLISCGRGNRYGHPDPAVLQRLRDAGIAWLRTDERGCLEIRWNGAQWALRTRSP